MEVALYNKKGKPVAYLAEDGETVYLWDGNPVAYLYEDKLYGLNGKQLGWFTNGTVFDIYGLRAGFIKSKSPIITELEPPKTMKQMRGVRKGKAAPSGEAGHVLRIFREAPGRVAGGRQGPVAPAGETALGLAW